MRGVIFIAFNEYVEHHFGYKALDALLVSGDYPNQGGFSMAESYCPSHLTKLVWALASQQRLDEAQVWFAFGDHAFGYLHQRFSEIYSNPSHPIFSNNTFEFVESLNILHFDELKKIYPKANFPRFEIQKRQNTLHLVYRSPLRLHDFVAGLLQGCCRHFSETIDIACQRHHQGSAQEYSEFLLTQLD